MSLHVTYANNVMLFVFNTSSPVEKYKVLSVDDNEHSRYLYSQITYIELRALHMQQNTYMYRCRLSL